MMKRCLLFGWLFVSELNSENNLGHAGFGGVFTPETVPKYQHKEEDSGGGLPQSNHHQNNPASTGHSPALQNYNVPRREDQQKRQFANHPIPSKNTQTLNNVPAIKTKSALGRTEKTTTIQSPGFGGLGAYNPLGGGDPLDEANKPPGPMGNLGMGPVLVNEHEILTEPENPCNNDDNANCEHYCREATQVEVERVVTAPEKEHPLVFVTESYAIVCYCAEGFTLRRDKHTCSNDEEVRLQKRLNELTFLSNGQDTWVIPVVVVCLIGAITILLIAGIAYFCMRKTDKQRQVLEQSMSGHSSSAHGTIHIPYSQQSSVPNSISGPSILS